MLSNEKNKVKRRWQGHSRDQTLLIVQLAQF